MLWIPYLVDILPVCVDDFGTDNYSAALSQLSDYLGGDFGDVWSMFRRTVCYSISCCRRAGHGHSLLGERHSIRSYSLCEQFHFMSAIVEAAYKARLQIVLSGDNND